MEKKMTKVTQDKTQTRSTIPQVFVDKHCVTREHKIEWESKGQQLKGTLVSPLKRNTTTEVKK